MTGPAWHQGRLAAVDTESTGTDVHTDRIITAAVVHANPAERPRTLTWVINPGVPIPQQASDIHGWTQDKIDAHLHGREASYKHPLIDEPIARSRRQALFEIAGQLAVAMSSGVPVVGMNLAYDLTLLEAECRRHHVPTLTERLAPQGIRGVVDVMVIEKHYSKRKTYPVCECGCGATSRRLTDLCKHWRVAHAGAHDAGGDALATLRLLGRLLAEYPELARMPLPKLYQSQIEWRASQMRSLASWFRRSGEHEKAETCRPEWPLVPAVPKAVA
jgi:DNA polymerase-3 subunit epsilon